jgi:succinyl-diaminopimelate desuccinylase
MSNLLQNEMREEAIMLADMAQLAPDPGSLESLLNGLGYDVRRLGNGWVGRPRGSRHPATLLFPLYPSAGFSLRRRQLVGREIARCATVVAGLSALRRLASRPTLLYLSAATTLPKDIRGEDVISLEGGVVPRVWDGCFGSFDVLARLTARASHPGEPNVGVNVIEESVPILQALIRLKDSLSQRGSARPQASDSPLMPRISICAAHGGFHGSMLPSMFDVIINRRYDPGENHVAALTEIEDAVNAAASAKLGVDLSLSSHKVPVPDPEAADRSRISTALAAGWGWPQTPFRVEPGMVVDSVLFGGLAQPSGNPEGDSAETSLDDMAALARSLCALLRPGSD